MSEQEITKCQASDRVALPTERQIRDSSELFKVMGDPTRLSVICTLLSGRQCVHELARIVDMSQSAISHQLRVLRQAHLVRYRRDGRHTWYTLADEHVRALVEVAIAHVDERYMA